MREPDVRLVARLVKATDLNWRSSAVSAFRVRSRWDTSLILWIAIRPWLTRRGVLGQRGSGRRLS